MIRVIVLSFLSLLAIDASAQNLQPISIQWNALYKEKPVQLEQEYLEDSLSLIACKFYISNLKLLNNDSIIHRFEDSIFLIDSEDITSTKRSLFINEQLIYDAISFDLGIDSVTNVSGVMGGDLDPTTGMYWTWQSGYINFKLEGVSPKCKTRKNKFHFHIGGYKNPYYPIRTITLPAIPKRSINIDFHIDRLLNKIDLSEDNTIMSPNQRSMHISSLFHNAFTSN